MRRKISPVSFNGQIEQDAYGDLVECPEGSFIKENRAFRGIEEEPASPKKTDDDEGQHKNQKFFLAAQSPQKRRVKKIKLFLNGKRPKHSPVKSWYGIGEKSLVPIVGESEQGGPKEKAELRHVMDHIGPDQDVQKKQGKDSRRAPDVKLLEIRLEKFVFCPR